MKAVRSLYELRLIGAAHLLLGIPALIAGVFIGPRVDTVATVAAIVAVGAGAALEGHMLWKVRRAGEPAGAVDVASPLRTFLVRVVPIVGPLALLVVLLSRPEAQALWFLGTLLAVFGVVSLLAADEIARLEVRRGRRVVRVGRAFYLTP